MADHGPAPALQPKDLILDVYGGFARDVGGWVAIGDLIALLSHVDVDAQAVRSAASRMKRSGLLLAERRGGVAGYALSEPAAEILRDGDARIFRDPHQSSVNPWVVATFSVPETQRRTRYLIRSRLMRLGFGQGPAASLFAPAVVVPETQRMLVRTGLQSYVTMWRGEHLGFGGIADLVADAWDLDLIGARHQAYLDRFEPVLDSWPPGERDDRRAFADYVGNLAAWRPLPYLDPGLPHEVTPSDWPAPAARSLFHRLERRLRSQAVRFFVSSTTG